MGRIYAGILGPLAFFTVVARGAIHGSALEPTLHMACLCLFAFAAIGYLAGSLAAATVTESVRLKINAELDAQEVQEQSTAG